MGFFANMKSINILNKGKKHANIGNFEKALVYFDDASIAATDGKTLHGHRSWYYLTLAVYESREMELATAREAFLSFIAELDAFKAECNKTPGPGTAARYNNTTKELLHFAERHDQYLNQIANK